MNKIKFLAAVATALTAGAASAAPTAFITSGPTTGVAGACTVTFDRASDDLTGGVVSCGSSDTPVIYSHSVGGSLDLGLLPGQIQNDSIENVAAKPVGSTGNYLTVGPASGGENVVAFYLESAVNYFGFLAGSLDTFNSVTFYLTNDAELTFTGAQLAALAGFEANGDQSRAVFWNIDFGSQFYDGVQFSSTSNAFESDNHAFGVIPAPGALALLGIGALGLGGSLRRRKAA